MKVIVTLILFVATTVLDGLGRGLVGIPYGDASPVEWVGLLCIGLSAWLFLRGVEGIWSADA